MCTSFEAVPTEPASFSNWLDLMLLLVDVDDGGLNKLFICWIDTLEELPSIGSFIGDVLFDKSFFILSKYLSNEIETNIHTTITIYLFKHNRCHRLTYRSGFSKLVLFGSMLSLIWLDLSKCEPMAIFAAKAVGRAIFDVWKSMISVSTFTVVILDDELFWYLTFFFGLNGLCGLESLECFCWLGLDVADWFRRFETGVFSTDLKYFSCMESSLPPPLPSMLFFFIGFGRGDDIKLPDLTSDIVGEPVEIIQVQQAKQIANPQGLLCKDFYLKHSQNFCAWKHRQRSRDCWVMTMAILRWTSSF